MFTKDKQVPIFQHKWFCGEILQKGKRSGQSGGWWISGVGSCQRTQAQRSAETLGSLAGSPGCLTSCFKILAIIFSFFHYSEFWSINHHKNEPLNLPQLNQFYLLLHFRELANLEAGRPGLGRMERHVSVRKGARKVRVVSDSRTAGGEDTR